MAGVNASRLLPNCANYNKFVDFAKSVGWLGGGTVVGADSSKRLVKATKGGGTSVAAMTKGVRTRFIESVCKLFRLKPTNADRLPKSVKDALELKDYNKGKAKPLTARCIKNVDEVVRKWFFEDLGKKISVSRKFKEFDLKEARLACRVFDNKGQYKSLLKQIAADEHRSGGPAMKLSEKERKRFEADPYSMCSGKKPVNTYLVNGQRLPVTKSDDDTSEIEPFINLSLADELTKRETITGKFLKGMKPGEFIPLKPKTEDPLVRKLPKDLARDLAKKGYLGLIVTGKGTAKAVTKNELWLKRTAMYFCQQSALSLAMGILFKDAESFGGEPICDTSKGGVQTVNVVRSPDGPGYDVVVRQRFFGVTGLKDSESGKMTSYYDPMKPGSWAAACVYHVGLKNGKPVVTYKVPPEAWANLPEPITKKKFASQALKYAEKHKDEIFKKLRDGTEPYWRQCSDKKLEGLLRAAVGQAVEVSATLGYRLDVENIVYAFSGLKEDVNQQGKGG